MFEYVWYAVGVFFIIALVMAVRKERLSVKRGIDDKIRTGEQVIAILKKEGKTKEVIK